MIEGNLCISDKKYSPLDIMPNNLQMFNISTEIDFFCCLLFGGGRGVVVVVRKISFSYCLWEMEENNTRYHKTQGVSGKKVKITVWDRLSADLVHSVL